MDDSKAGAMMAEIKHVWKIIAMSLRDTAVCVHVTSCESILIFRSASYFVSHSLSPPAVH